VFASVKGARPRRKVAISVPDGMSWGDFEAQVKAKLRVDAVGSVNLATTGERVTSVASLEDIDELIVDPAPAPPGGGRTAGHAHAGPR